MTHSGGGKRWTEAETNTALAMRDEGAGLADIARTVGRTKTAVREVFYQVDRTKANTAMRDALGLRSIGIRAIGSKAPELIRTRRVGGCRLMIDGTPCGAETDGRYCQAHATQAYDRPDKHKADRTNYITNLRRYG